MPIKTLEWKDHEGLEIIDQRLLPLTEKYILLTTTKDVAEAIKSLAVRGAPAIGVAAAYGVVVAAIEKTDREHVRNSIALLRETRPTAVNLFHALDKMSAELSDAFASADPVGRLLECAHSLYEEDMKICRTLSGYGAQLLADGETVLTHCNAGGLATTGYGTALGIIYAAQKDGKRISVFADETRPLLQGMRLTAWELSKNGVPVTVICDSMASEVYGLSLSAREHGVPFYVAAPLTSFDFSLSSGNDIPIEERDPAEIHSPFGSRMAPEGVSFYNPAFDITPAENISAIISEKGVARPPFETSLKSWLATVI